nr:hypothetical protein [Streptomyces griseocarneus]
MALRSRAITALAGRGGMVSVALPAGEVGVLLEPFGERISVAAVNGPRSTVVAGESAALDEFLAAAEAGVSVCGGFLSTMRRTRVRLL